MKPSTLRGLHTLSVKLGAVPGRVCNGSEKLVCWYVRWSRLENSLRSKIRQKLVDNNE
jgi:hypothetical protein